jgi:hypothetical protein
MHCRQTLLLAALQTRQLESTQGKMQADVVLEYMYPLMQEKH